jgi:transcriptional/translational regulatory protein YebC/TACO1
MFSKQGGNMGAEGSVAWMFDRKGQILIDKEHAKEDDLMNLVLEAGADDLRDDGDQWEILSATDAHMGVVDAIEKAKIPIATSGIAMIPKNLVTVTGKQAVAILKLTENLEEHDDVQSVFSNMDIDEKEMEALA